MNKEVFCGTLRDFHLNSTIKNETERQRKRGVGVEKTDTYIFFNVVLKILSSSTVYAQLGIKCRNYLIRNIFFQLSSSVRITACGYSVEELTALWVKQTHSEVNKLSQANESVQRCCTHSANGRAHMQSVFFIYFFIIYFVNIHLTTISMDSERTSIK